MAKKNTTTNQSKTDKPRLRLFSFFKKRETQIVLGILLVGVSIYLSIVVLSFLLTGSADYSKVNTRSFAELSQLEGNIRNFGGGFGAWISNFIVNHWFGFPILFPILFVGAMGLRLFGIQRIKPVQLFFITSFSLIWSSLALGFFFRTLYESSFLYWGGAHGHFASIWMRKQIGWPGVFLILLSTL
ncbi:MAG: DNA translocase FtsK 4TM domain-containing protein, partial [Bacteroidales bacterium]|nr:DNA translocase FtsK 4TM domain-containing protein [Bacteroidales bacterium]